MWTRIKGNKNRNKYWATHCEQWSKKINIEINIEVPIVMPPNMYTCSGAKRHPAGISQQPLVPVLRTKKSYGLICCLYILNNKTCPKTLKNAPKINKMFQEICRVFHNSLPHLSWERKMLSSGLVCCEWGKVATDAMSNSCEQNIHIFC